MGKFETEIKLVCDKIRHAGVLLIGAGAGLSAAAGLDYSGKSFRESFADYIEKYGFPDLYSSSFYEFPSEEERWARWARHVDYARFRPGVFPLYRELLRLATPQDYFVITTNVDGQFIKAGFDPLKVFEVQGDYGMMQCARGCHQKVYLNESVVREMLANSSNLTIPAALVPHCPVCGGNMDIHVRKNNFFVEDENWHAAADRYEKFIEMNIGSAIVLLELGVGFNTPGIIRYPFESFALANPKAFFVRVNNHDDYCSPALRSRSIVFKNDINTVIESLVSGLTA